MRTKLTIVGIVGSCMIAVLAVFVVTWLWLEWVGLGACLIGAIAVVSVYVRFIRPWHSRWGATDDEVSRVMPGDEIVLKAASTTRAISIGAPPDRVWPWLVQIGYGRAGWYSYDWIDNDGQPSARRIVPEFQGLKVGHVIEMLPGFGPQVIEIVPDSHFVTGDGEGGTWCLAVYPERNGSRLVSRWRQEWKTDGLGPKFFVAIADPGAFIMEQKMLHGIKERAESQRSSLDQRTSASARGPREEVA